MINFQSVLSTDQHYKALIAKEILNSHAIENFVMNKQDTAYGLGFGYFQLFVHPNNRKKAHELLIATKL